MHPRMNKAWDQMLHSQSSIDSFEPVLAPSFSLIGDTLMPGLSHSPRSVLIGCRELWLSGSQKGIAPWTGLRQSPKF
jgi:hypothetical protein